jgi:transcriptional regulator with XRE-family HTH domain
VTPANAPTTTALGLAIRQLRKGAGMSQEDLAHASDLHPTYVSGIERGHRNPTWRILARVCDALEVRMSELSALAERQDGSG